MIPSLVRGSAVLAAAVLMIGASIALSAPANAAASLTWKVEVKAGPGPTDWVDVTNGSTLVLTAGRTYAARAAVTNSSLDEDVSLGTVTSSNLDLSCTNAVLIAGTAATGYCNGTIYIPIDQSDAPVDLTLTSNGVGMLLSDTLSTFGLTVELSAMVTTEDSPGGAFRNAVEAELAQLPLGFTPQIEVWFANNSNASLSGLSFDPALCSAPGGTWTSVLAKEGDPGRDTPSCIFTAPSPATSTPVTYAYSASGIEDVTGTAVTATGVSTYSGDGGCTLKHAKLAVGETQTVTCVGFLGGIEVGAVLDENLANLGSPQTGTGTFSFDFVVPASAASGSHVVTIVHDGFELTRTLDFTVVNKLAVTGMNAAPVVAIGFGALAAGIVVLLVTRRRATERTR